ncbi:Ku protein [Kyrpidia sp.]|uniref:non-homologous end joining protein Ku n=1 Tax=Kyrpidia sp. TaxID=2073077 RepID=UPI00258C1A32|nr:Ku protein [Kyrpidia sp.]
MVGNRSIGGTIKVVQSPELEGSQVRALWKGSISFGLVNIPIKLYAAVEDRDIHFRQLHNRCKTPIQYKKWCAHCNETVTADEIVRGYEWRPGEFVILTDDDLAHLPLPSLHTVEITQFVRVGEVDPIYFERTYYLSPQEFGEKPYQLLHRAMQETDLAALAKIALRSKEHLAILRCYNHVLALSMLHFPDELRSTAELPNLAGIEVKAAELEMAKELINRLASPFHPEAFHNEYGKALREYIASRVSENQVVQVRPPEKNVVDLMEALQASLQAVQVKARPDGERQTEGKRQAEPAGRR